VKFHKAALLFYRDLKSVKKDKSKRHNPMRFFFLLYILYITADFRNLLIFLVYM